MTDPAVTYATYLRVDELLSLQQPRSEGPEHDELLRHVKMVERTIGVKPGTGGSAGAAYLRETISRPAVP